VTDPIPETPPKNVSRLKADFQACRDAYDFFTHQRNGHLDRQLYKGQGGALLEQFYHEHEDYYPFRDESKFYEHDAGSIAYKIKDTERLIIVGPGPADLSLANKELWLLPHLQNLKQADIVDISRDFAVDGAFYLTNHFQSAGRTDIKVNAITSDYRNLCPKLVPMANTTAISTGSTFSNVANVEAGKFPEAQLREFLRDFRAIAGNQPGAKLVLGYDSCQDPEEHDKAYNHPLLSQIMLNGISCLARDCHGMKGLDPDRVEEFFNYVPVWDQTASCRRQNVMLKKPLHLEFAPEILRPGEPSMLDLQPGQSFTVQNAVKPRSTKTASIAREVGLKTDIILKNGRGITEHIFNVIPLPT
jgi:uncharacterized SAM-dependent methyltransferase